jgi:hypothetical protein
MAVAGILRGSLRYVQLMADHSALTTTQPHTEHDVNAQRRAVELMAYQEEGLL